MVAALLATSSLRFVRRSELPVASDQLPVTSDLAHDENASPTGNGQLATVKIRCRWLLDATGRLIARGSVSAFLGARRFTRSGGAGESGLSRLLELHAFNTAGDAAVAVSLAGTLFFSVPTNYAMLLAHRLWEEIEPDGTATPAGEPGGDRWVRPHQNPAIPATTIRVPVVMRQAA